MPSTLVTASVICWLFITLYESHYHSHFTDKERELQRGEVLPPGHLALASPLTPVPLHAWHTGCFLPSVTRMTARQFYWVTGWRPSHGAAWWAEPSAAPRWGWCSRTASAADFFLSNIKKDKKVKFSLSVYVIPEEEEKVKWAQARLEPQTSIGVISLYPAPNCKYSRDITRFWKQLFSMFNALFFIYYVLFNVNNLELFFTSMESLVFGTFFLVDVHPLSMCLFGYLANQRLTSDVIRSGS